MEAEHLSYGAECWPSERQAMQTSEQQSLGRYDDTVCLKHCVTPTWLLASLLYNQLGSSWRSNRRSRRPTSGLPGSAQAWPAWVDVETLTRSRRPQPCAAQKMHKPPRLETKSVSNQPWSSRARGMHVKMTNGALNTLSNTISEEESNEVSKTITKRVQIG
eukprot:scaffold403398_cov17-Prasinocladus_malaysianus.AAC.1